MRRPFGLCPNPCVNSPTPSQLWAAGRHNLVSGRRQLRPQHHRAYLVPSPDDFSPVFICHKGASFSTWCSGLQQRVQFFLGCNSQSVSQTKPSLLQVLYLSQVVGHLSNTNTLLDTGVTCVKSAEWPLYLSGATHGAGPVPCLGNSRASLVVGGEGDPAPMLWTKESCPHLTCGNMGGGEMPSLLSPA